MEKISWEIVLGFLTQDDLYSIEQKLSLEELREIKRKAHEVIGCMHFSSHEIRAMAEKTFILGYLASYSFYPKGN